MNAPRTRAMLAGLLGGVLALAACAPADAGRRAHAAADVAAAERYGGTAVVAIASDPQSLNPLLMATNETGMLQASLLSLRLFHYGENLQIESLLAERWDTVRVAPDTLQLTLHLRRDVRWHDGTPTTAEDVRFTFERMIDPEVAYAFNAPLAMWSPRVEVLDSFTVRFRLRAHSDFLDYWTANVLVPAHLLRDVPPARLRDHTFWGRPVGNGPFRFVRHLPNQELVFEANPDFPEALGGRPYLDRLVVRVIPDANTRLIELLRRSLDLSAVTAAQVPQVEQSGELSLRAAEQRNYATLIWNTRLPMFGDARVRRALGMAIDREALVQAFLAGRGEIGRFTATPWHWQWDTSDPETRLPHDTAAANRLLDEAGWRFRDGSGVRSDDSGTPLRFVLRAPSSDPLYADLLPAVQAQLRQVGADVRAQFVEMYTLYDMVDGQRQPNGGRRRDFEAVLVPFGSRGRLDDRFLLHSRSREDATGAPGFVHARADWLIDTLAVTADRDAARPLWREYHRLMVREAPMLVLFYPQALLAVRDRLRDVDFEPGGGAFATAHRWWIAPGDRDGNR